METGPLLIFIAVLFTLFKLNNISKTLVSILNTLLEILSESEKKDESETE